MPTIQADIEIRSYRISQILSLLISTFIQQRRSAIYQDRLQDLQRDALIGWKAAQRGESIDGPTAIAQIRDRLHAKIDYHCIR